MTLDDFLRALEGLIEDRESSDDQPGEGNFGCEDCRACNHCRFCIGCDSCEDCTYCEECIDCTSATQSKRCVGCQKVSYCEDSRDCTNSRYLTLCVSCNDCVHCLACVGLQSGEFYVLNEKRTRKQYFTLLRQVQELMAGRMNAGWRPPNIGLASDILDPRAAGRDAELTAAPWLDDEGDIEPDDDSEPETRRARAIRDDWSVRSSQPEPSASAGRRWSADDSEVRRARDPRRDRDRDEDRGWRRESSLSSPPLPEPREPSREPSWVREPPPEFGVSYHGDREDERTRPRPRPRDVGRLRPDFGSDLGRELGDDSWARDLGREPGRDSGRERELPSTRDSSWAHEDEHELDEHDAPRQHEQQPTQPFERQWDPFPEPRVAGRGRDSEFDDLLSPPDEPPAGREREPSSPWLDDDQAQARRVAKRGSLRRAGRPPRPSEPAPRGREVTGTGSGSGSGSGSQRKEGTYTGTGLRLGRKPKRR